MDATDTAIHASLQRDVGRLEGKVDAIDGRVAGIDTKLDQLVTYIEREKGSRRTLATVGTVGGSVAGAIVAALVSWWTR